MTARRLDVGTTGVKALALPPDGARARRAQYPLDTAPRLGRAGSRTGGERAKALAALGAAEIAGIGLSADARSRRADAPIEAAARDPLNDGRTGAECAEIGARRLSGDLADGNRALPASAPKLPAAPPRAGGLAQVRRPPAEGLRAPAAHRERATDVADASGTLLFDVARRRWSDGTGGARAARNGCRLRRSRRRSRLHTRRRSVAPARATRRPARSASAWTGRAPSRSRSAPPASPARPPSPPTPRASTPSAMPSPRLARWG